MTADQVESLAGDDDLLEVGRQAIENALIAARDARIAVVGRNNGLVCREADGSDSFIICYGPEDALRIGLRAIAAHLKRDRNV